MIIIFIYIYRERAEMPQAMQTVLLQRNFFTVGTFDMTLDDQAILNVSSIE